MTLLEGFLEDRIDPSDFNHRAHVEVALALLERHDFNTAHMTYVDRLKALTIRAGVPEKFNATVTFAAMSIIAERLARHGSDAVPGIDEFLSANPDLLDARTFTAGYSRERLASDMARRQPLLPDLAA